MKSTGWLQDGGRKDEEQTNGWAAGHKPEKALHVIFLELYKLISNWAAIEQHPDSFLICQGAVVYFDLR